MKRQWFSQDTQTKAIFPPRKTKTIIIAASAICLLFLRAGMAATGTVNYNTIYQQLEGFGAAGAWYEGWLTAHPQKATLYDILFRDLGLDIYRIRNTYGLSGGNDYINRTEEIVLAGKARNPNLKIMISSWSPPASLKSNGSTVGGTLKKDPNGIYQYGPFGDWWANSLTAWENNNVHADYINIQNEPDYTASWDTCFFAPSQTDANAGYNLAFRAVYQKVYDRMGSNMPKMLAPETAGLGICGNYINVLDDNAVDLSHIYGFAHHLYDGSYSDPDSRITAMSNFRTTYGYKPLFQTEYSDGSGNTDFTYAMYLARHIHNSLVYERICAYLYWDLFWDEYGLVAFHSYGSPDYTVTPCYYAFKHFAYFTDPNWYRVDATASPSSNLRMTAFKDPNNYKLTIVILNKSTGSESLTLTLNGFTPINSEVYRTTADANFAYIGAFSNPVSLPAQSITTIYLTSYSNCYEVQLAGLWLLSDIIGDCYVDYNDVAVIAQNWLRTDCSIYNSYCDYTDFPWGQGDGKVDFVDLDIFGDLWGLCNDPQDANCIQNW